MENEEEHERCEKTTEEVFIISDNLKLCEDISLLHGMQEDLDVNFFLDEQTIRAHKAALATRRKNLHNTQSKITLTDVSSKALKEVLKYNRTGSITITPPDVKLILEVLRFANFFDRDHLRDACHSFLDKNVSDVLTSDCLNNLTQKSMIKLLERDTFIAPEVEIFKSVEKWSKKNEDVDKLVLKCVRLSLLSEEEILLIVRPSKLVEDATLLNIRTEIAEGKRRAPKRGVLLKDQNLATPERKAQVTSGTNTDFLLSGIGNDENVDKDKCASHSFGDKNGITVRLDVPFYINHIYMKLWEGDRGSYFYYIEVSLDGIKWEKVIDYSLYRCRSYQNIYFEQEIIAQYIRVVGTNSTKNEVFDLVSFETYFKTSFPSVINGIVCPTENVATKNKGAVLVEGTQGTESKHLSDVIYHHISADNIIVHLAQPYLISYIKLQLHTPEDTYRYFIETSINKWDWEIAVDRRHIDCQGEQILHFSARSAVYVKITGTHTSDVINSFYCKDLECYYSDCT